MKFSYPAQSREPSGAWRPRSGAAALAAALMLASCNDSAPSAADATASPGVAAPAFAAAQAAGAGATTAADPAAPAPFYASPFERKPGAAELADLGRALFSDRALSSSGRLACASCHDPAHAYGPANRLAVQLGGADMAQPGLRAVPSLTYRQQLGPFNEHSGETDGDDSADLGPASGRDWDGRAASAHEQAAGPLLSPFEMGNADPAAAVARLAQSPSADRFRSTFGAGIFDAPDLAWNGLLLALEVFQQLPADFYPYNSKYDAFLRGKAKLDEHELRGMALFNDAAKGNCAQCHPSGIKRGAFPQFTDDGYAALAIPRNAAIPANANAEYYDLGLCGPLRDDLKEHADYCGMFRVPSLRNVALRQSFFHNGAFHNLRDAVRFYAQRDAYPDRLYSHDRAGKTRRYDDVPDPYRANVNNESPFNRQHPGKPSLTDGEIAAIVAFLGTLTDGYSPAQ